MLSLITLPLARAADLEFLEKLFGGDAKEPLPLVIAIHGLGDTPERYRTLFDGLGVRARLITPRAPDAWPVGSSWFPIDDAKRAPGVLRERAVLLADFAARLAKARKARGLPIVTGFSQGGCLSFALAAYHSDKFSAALPVAGKLLPSMPAARRARADFRVIAFHGEQDKRIAIADGERTVANLDTTGTRATLVRYAGLGHGFNADLLRDYFAALREEVDRVR